MDEALHQHAEAIAEMLGRSLSAHSIAHGELTITVAPADIVAVVKALRDDPRCQYWSLIDVTAIDWPSREPRFDVVYHFLSPRHNRRVRVKAQVAEGASIASIIEVFPLTGFVEVRYDDEQKRVVYEPVRLAQEFRNFDFLSPWEGPDYPLPGDERAGKAGDRK